MTAGVGAAALAGTGVCWGMRPGPALVTSLMITTPDSAAFTMDGNTRDLAITRDGRSIIYTASDGLQGLLVRRSMDSVDAAPFAGLSTLQNLSTLENPFTGPPPPIAGDPGSWLQAFVGVPHLLEVRPDDLFGEAGPPVEVQGGELHYRVLPEPRPRNKYQAILGGGSPCPHAAWGGGRRRGGSTALWQGAR